MNTQSLAQTAQETSAEASVVSVDGEDSASDELREALDTSGNVQKLVIDDVILGEGRVVEKGDTIAVQYIGTLQNGQQFDNSYKKGKSFEFTVGEGRVIAGWDKGVIGMQVGGQRILVIPPELGYGENGVGPIPGDATLVFAIELLSIK